MRLGIARRKDPIHLYYNLFSESFFKKLEGFILLLINIKNSQALLCYWVIR